MFVICVCLFQKSEAERLEEQIILADSLVCIALLTFLQQDVSGYMKGGWILRKAWKVYQHSYQKILHLYKRTFGFDQNVPGWLISSFLPLQCNLSVFSIPLVFYILYNLSFLYFCNFLFRVKSDNLSMPPTLLTWLRLYQLFHRTRVHLLQITCLRHVLNLRTKKSFLI